MKFGWRMHEKAENILSNEIHDFTVYPLEGIWEQKNVDTESAAALLFSGIAGMVAVIGVHLAGYLRMMDGYTETSLLARAVPGNFIDGTLSYWQSVALFLALIVILMVLSSVFVKKIEFQSGTEVEG